MVFSSLIFLCVFLPITLTVYYAAPARLRNGVALAASLFFYSWGAPRFVFVLTLSSLVDYGISHRLSPGAAADRHRKRLLVLVLALNLAVFLYFKYMNFFVEQFNRLLTLGDLQPLAWTRIALPIGLSFFTFQKLSYLVDVYRGTTPPARSPLQHLLYVTLFPQLIAGPIIRYHDVAAQLLKRRFSAEQVLQGLWRFGLGLAKKVLVANVLGRVADLAFNSRGVGLSTGGAWLGALCYAFQIYFDFSGYSDMAIGLGRMLGFRFLENFDSPYIATNFTAFWRRWHISLSNWMREYLYIPLGGNRKGKARTHLNLWIVFFLSGFWHGASWNFIVWGLYHGLFLSLDKFTAGWQKKVPALLAVPCTFLLVLLGWVFFRAETLTEAGVYLARLFTPGPVASLPQVAASMTPQAWLALGVAAGYSFLPALWRGLRSADWAIEKRPPREAALVLLRSAATGLLVVLSMMALVTGKFNPFIYFRF